MLAGFATAVAGISLIILAAFGQGVLSAPAALSAVAGAALVELFVGARLPMHAGSPATAHLFIVNPFSAAGLASLFSTHPSTQERIKRLQEMAHRGWAISV
jgi:Zn-dependent protease with chaperone function